VPTGTSAAARMLPVATTGVREVAVDHVLAKRHGIHVGDSLVVLGRPLRVVGLTCETASFMTGCAFVTYMRLPFLQRRVSRVSRSTACSRSLQRSRTPFGATIERTCHW
jgi:hypothetical protein